jgi:hypothetical protein
MLSGGLDKEALNTIRNFNVELADAIQEKMFVFEDFNDIDFPQADEGTPQCVVFGECWTGDWMVLGYGNYRTQEIRKSNPGK